MMGFIPTSRHERRCWSTLSRLVATCTLTLSFFATSTFAQASNDKTAADYFVKSLPGQPEGPLLRMHAGHIEITPEHNGNLFFWHYANRHIANRQRTVIWLNGGPGCSSEDGALMEIGPYRINPDGTLRYNDGSWDEFANLLFVDNPVGTGFSYVDGDSYLHELSEMADNFLLFLEKFFKLFPEYEMDDLYVAGESYAGQHIPYIANHIIERNKGRLLTGGANWNLKGLLIGNGWMSGPEQYRSYTTYAYQAGMIQGGTEGANKVDAALSRCLDEMNKKGAAERVSISACESVLSTILDVSQKDRQCYNMYDTRLKDSYPSCGMNWPPDLEYLTPYLRRTDVTRALHINFAKREGWSECNGAVSSTFRALNSTASVSLLPRIMEQGVPIVLFAGDKDLICNHIGIEDMISNMQWNGGTGFELSPGVWAPKRDWDFEGEPAGIYQEARNLTYIKFYNSSHMVPFDYPRRSRDMLDRFMRVDIASIGGVPADSRLDGEKAGVETSVGGHPNSTLAAEEEKKKLKAAAYKAYYRSGEVALVVVIIAAVIWAWWVWRSRRKDGSGLGNYMTIPAINGSSTGLNGHAPGASASAGVKGKSRDLEAGDFDESELDDLSRIRGTTASGRLEDQEPYDLASDSDDDGGHEHDMGDAKKRGHYSDKDGLK